MSINKGVKILAMGKYLPKEVLSSEIEKKHNIPLGWSIKYSGVKSRHHVTFESGGYMGAKAIEKALEKTKLNLSDIDLIISASGTFDYPLPSQSSIIKSALKDGLNSDAAALDINSTCLSFVSAFEIAARLLDGKQYKYIVVVSTEISSKGLDESNWETQTLFGDGAVAAVFAYDDTKDSSFIKGAQKTYSIGVKYTIIEGGGNQFTIKDNPYDPKLHSFKMEGKKLLRLAKKKIPEFMNWFFEETGMTILDTDAVIPHQASKVGLAIFNKLFQFKENQLKQNIETHGNCIAASIPMLLHDEIESGGIKRGDICFLTGTSAGFSIGGILFKY